MDLKGAVPAPKHKTELTEEGRREQTVRRWAIPVGALVVGLLVIAPHITPDTPSVVPTSVSPDQQPTLPQELATPVALPDVSELLPH